MLHHLLVSGLILLTCSTGVMADIHRNDEQLFEARFPTKAQSRTSPVDENSKCIMAFSKESDRIFMVGTITGTGEEMNHEQVQEFGSSFVESYMESRKNACILKEEELKLNETTPRGISYLVKHDTGCFFLWTTIENGQPYFVLVEGVSETIINDDVVRNFQKSVKIMSAK